MPRTICCCSIMEHCGCSAACIAAPQQLHRSFRSAASRQAAVASGNASSLQSVHRERRLDSGVKRIFVAGAGWGDMSHFGRWRLAPRVPGVLDKAVSRDQLVRLLRPPGACVTGVLDFARPNQGLLCWHVTASFLTQPLRITNSSDSLGCLRDTTGSRSGGGNILALLSQNVKDWRCTKAMRKPTTQTEKRSSLWKGSSALKVAYMKTTDLLCRAAA